MDKHSCQGQCILEFLVGIGFFLLFIFIAFELNQKNKKELKKYQFLTKEEQKIKLKTEF